MADFFKNGTIVEVSSDEEGFRGAWYIGTIVRRVRGKNKFVVEYKTLLADENSSAPLQETLDLVQLRPLQPPDHSRSFAFSQEVDAYHNDGWWEGVITAILPDDVYSVFFRGTREQLDFGLSDLRLHREWNNGKWNPPFEEQAESSSVERVSKDPRLNVVHFSKGTTVEVSSEEEGFQGAWFSAKVIEQMGNKFIIEYNTLRNNDDTAFLQEEVDSQHIRPDLPEKFDRGWSFKVGDEVDAFHNDGWWEGYIVEVLPDDMYTVYFRVSRDQLKFGPSNIRIHREWLDGKWIPPLLEKTKPSSTAPKRKRVNKKPPKNLVHFSKGTAVEVSSDEEGFVGAWFSATVIEQINNNKFIIEYKTLRNHNDTAFLQEEVDNEHIRPDLPKNLDDGQSFKIGDEVDAYHNDGWWEGVIVDVLPNDVCTVFFRLSREQIDFGVSDLCIHREWSNGKWIPMFQEEINSNSRATKKECVSKDPPVNAVHFSQGTDVEVSSDEEGF
jgi:hypothetical protein